MRRVIEHFDMAKLKAKSIRPANIDLVAILATLREESGVEGALTLLAVRRSSPLTRSFDLPKPKDRAM